MSQFNQNSMTDRLKAATEAREAALARFRDRPAADDPAVLARKAERERIVREREARTRARDEARLAAEAQRRAEEERERERLAAEAIRAAEEKVEQAAAARLEQKALRDARYAARKAKARK
ncbi:hypothetical protein PMNALOAF_4128 [Methylobacterium adhaesivum]|uniref:DUF6481 family protein n=1 Tax=Methylobacterium adhaesivum TaxID=333297 RepID=A0ABT8BMH1_9HYPH|nr:DUF6481 family protein [Methylobacterium adhaesivum]MDN3592506.1 DUF6481 family protein [Methylobacterium adhaesivum]GJD32848.1 hypothetical protein PMNALOAF_4128 [Methylobacterium adhaesivum]